jgi:hypothetical protein
MKLSCATGGCHAAAEADDPNLEWQFVNFPHVCLSAAACIHQVSLAMINVRRFARGMTAVQS